MIETAQQLAWLSAVFRKPSADSLCLSKVDFMSIGHKQYLLRPAGLEAATVDEKASWHALLGQTVIAESFPIPARQGEVGLEIPLPSLVRLAKIYAEVEVNKKIALYGSSTLLYPTGWHYSRTRSCIQWGLVMGDPPEKSASFVAARDSWSEVDEKSLIPNARSIVVGDANTRASGDAKSHENRRTKGSALVSEQSLLSAQIAPIGVDFPGMGIFGLQVAIDATHPRSISTPRKLPGLDDILAASRRILMILCDTETQSSWLVPTQHVLLHLVKRWIKINAPTIKLDVSNTDAAETDGAESVLAKNENLVMKILMDDDSEWYLRDLVRKIWIDLQGCKIASALIRSQSFGSLKKATIDINAWKLADFIDRPLFFDPWTISLTAQPSALTKFKKTTRYWCWLAKVPKMKFL